MPRIFISYRRSDSQTISGRIYDRLRASFGSSEFIFKDVISIPPGVDFRTYIDQELNRCDVALIIIGPDWLNAVDVEGRRRLDNPQDFVRQEIEAALARRLTVIPVLVQDASMPPPKKLPKSLQPLTYLNAARVRDDPDFHHDMDLLLATLSRTVQQERRPEAAIPPPARLQPPGSVRPRSRPPARRIGKLPRRLACGLVAVLLAVICLALLTQTDLFSDTEETKESQHPLEALFHAEPPEGTAPLTVHFFNDTQGADLEFHWDLGDGDGSTAENPEHTYTGEGVYAVTLRVTRAGQEALAERVIHVLPPVFCGPADTPAVLRVQMVSGIVPEDQFESDIAAFEQNCPTIRLEIERIDEGSYRESFFMRMQAGDLGDIFMFERGMVPDLLQFDVLFNLNPFLSPEETEIFDDPFPEGQVFGLHYRNELWLLGVSSRSERPENAAAFAAFLTRRR